MQDDCISRQDVLDLCDSTDPEYNVINFKEDVECLPSVQPEQRLIPVSERLPEDDYIVMISIHEDRIDYVSTGFYDNGWEMWLDHYDEMVNVVAWMHLPEPYQSKGGE